MPFLEWLEATPLGAWIRELIFGYPMVLSAHAVGMGVVVGVVFMLSLRVLGFAKRLPISGFESLLNLAWWGFALNAVSGAMLFAGNATKLAANLPFLLKLMFIAAGGVSVWALWRTVGPGASEPPVDGAMSARAKTVAVVTVVFWAAAILAGRLIGYTIKYD